MRVVLFGATGMVGKGVLIECLEDPRVGAVLVVGRQPCNVALREAIDDVADNDEERARLRALGTERAARYTWRETAERTLDVYRSVARS